jgi:hemerythrin-like metal-binding protein
MRSLKWSTSEAVWIEEIDDEHKEIFAGVANLQKVLAGGLSEIRQALDHLTGTIAGHFEHEERLMRASRYGSLRWHQQMHSAACRNVKRFALAIERGDREAGRAMVEYLTQWLPNHARVADRMMGAHLRNRQLSVGKLVFRAGTKAANACTWVDASGNAFDPLATTKSL